MELKLKKQPQKYLASVGAPTRKSSIGRWTACPGWRAISSRLKDIRTDTAIRSCITA